jgi:DNA-nicking Smr family endonuclease
MSRRLSSEERALWRRVGRTVRLSPGRVLEPEPEAAPQPAAASPPSAAKRAGDGPRIAARRIGPPEDLSGQRRIRRGQMEIDAKLDLHGHTQDTARHELVRFILREAAAGARCVLVITGKGRLGTGILRTRLFDWIADPGLRAIIAGHARAHPRHGGEGATYLFLREPKR